jgi:hypothetical protein
MKMPRLATVFYTMLIAFVLILVILRVNHQLSTVSFWQLFSLGLVLGMMGRRLPRPQAAKV